MFDIQQILEELRRPRILVRAAKFGLARHTRDSDLKRGAQAMSKSSPAAVLDQLLTQEGDLEKARVSGQASYDIHRHIGLLTSVLAVAKQVLSREQKMV